MHPSVLRERQRRIRTVAAYVAAVALATQTATGQDLQPLQRALELADLYNWIDAAPVFEEAAAAKQGSAGEHAIAQCGALRASMEEKSLPDLAEEISAVVARVPEAEGRRARAFCVAVRADVYGELDARLMRRDWEEVRRIAQTLGDAKLENRAAGEIGLASFLEGDVVAARQLVAGALVKATILNDAGGQVRFLSAIGNGLALTGNADQALGYFDKASKIVASSPDHGFPFFLEAGRLQALRSLRRFDGAEALGQRIVDEARSRRKMVKEAQALITLASIAETRGDDALASQRLREAIGLSQSGGFPRLAATARVDLADIHRKAGDLAVAEDLLMSALDDTASSGEAFLMPRRLQSLAQLQIAQGKFPEADATFARAEDIVQVLLVNNPNLSARTALVNALGEIHVEHFSLIARKLNDPSRAFDVLEQIRGRSLRDLLAAGSPVSTDEPEIDREIALLRIQLVRAKTAAERKALNEKIFLFEQQRWTTKGEPSSLAQAKVTLESVQAFLASDELLLGYVLAETQSYCLVVSQRAARIVTLAASLKKRLRRP